MDRGLLAAAQWGSLALTPLLAQMDPDSLSIPDYLARRYDLVALAGAGDQARRMIAAGQYAGVSATSNGLVDPSAAPPTARELHAASRAERTLASALHCRATKAVALPGAIRGSSRTGGYQLTHAAFAFEIARQRGCFDRASGRSLHQTLTGALRAEIAAARQVDDLQIERLAILSLLGESLPPGPVVAVAAAQQPDGTWVDVSGRLSSWHPTMLAVWALAAAAERGQPVPFVGGPSTADG